MYGINTPNERTFIVAYAKKYDAELYTKNHRTHNFPVRRTVAVHLADQKL